MLGDAVVGVILHGSLTLGDYVPGRSDIDLLAVVEEPLTDAEFSALVDAAASEPAAPVPVDLRVATRQVATAPTFPPPMEAYLRIGSAVRVEARNVPERDLVVELSVCRAHGRALAGPRPSHLIGEVPDRWVVEVGRAQLADWQRLEYEPQYGDLIVLTACRVWRFADEGRHCSKTDAGTWALARDQSLRAVGAALRRRGGDSTPIDEEDVRTLLAVVLEFLT